MGEIADMMIDGDLCEGCGVYMGSPGQGFPRRCGPCSRDQARTRDVQSAPPKFAAPKNSAKVACKTCGRHVKAVGLDQHMRDRHGGPKPLAQQLNEIEHEEQP